MWLVLLLLPSLVASLNPICQPHKAETIDQAKKYIFLFDLEMDSAKMESWKFLVKAMSCALPHNENVTMSVATIKGDEIKIQQSWSSFEFPDKISGYSADSTTSYRCLNLEKLKEAVEKEKGTPMQIISLLDTSVILDCGMDHEFEKYFQPNGTIQFDEIHIGPTAAESFYMKLTDDWSDLNPNKTEMFQSEDMSIVLEFGSLQDQITRWAKDENKRYPRRPPLHSTTEISTTQTEETSTTTIEEEEALKTTVEEEETSKTIVEEEETTLIEEEIDSFGEEMTVTLGEISSDLMEITEISGEWNSEVSITEESTTIGILPYLDKGEIGEMRIQVDEKISSEAVELDKETTSGSISLIGIVTSSPDTTTELQKVTKEMGFWEWLISEWLHILLLFFVVLILLIALLICCLVTCRKRKGKADYSTIEGDSLDTAIELQPIVKTPMKAKEVSTESSAEKGEAVVQVKAEKEREERSPLLRVESTPLPIPHKEEGFEEPFSPAIPSPYMRRNSEIAVTPVQPDSYSESERHNVTRQAPAETPRNNFILDE